MGFGLTLKLFLSHLFTEPLVALEGFMNSIKDVIEILYFYFTELSLTACYVILFVIAVRFLLRKAPKIYSYALWGVVYFKLVSVFKFEFFKRSLIPQPQIDKIYYDITPDYTAFYSTEAGIVSQINSDFVAPVHVVTPIYTPALIWFAVLCIILAVSAVMYFTAYSKLKNSNLNNLKDNVYISGTISTPFVFGIIRPTIYLPKGLTEQQQNYVITHEKVHIRRGDHIIKLFAFVITCIHWFNPLVWLSFFLLEKDMEMSCDEKVLQILGNEHKKDYSYCILSLAADKRFVPKAYLSFGDSDTKKRIKNVLNYKKPAVIASIMAIIGIAVITVGMLADSDVVYVPDAENIGNRTHQINFPVYDQRTEHNTEIFDSNFALLMQLPADWSVKIPEDYDVAYPLVGMWNRMGIYDETGKLVGAIGYNIYDTTQTEPMAIYNQIALGNHYQFAVHGEDYFAVATGDVFVTSTTNVYTSAVMAQQLGMGSEDIVNHGILCRNNELGVYVAIEIDKNSMDDAQLNNIAHSVFIAEPVVNNPFSSTYDALNSYNRFNFSLDGDTTSVSIPLPWGYSFESRNIQPDEYPAYLSLDDDFSDVFDIYDENRNLVGAMGFIIYREQMSVADNLMAIYGPVALPNMYNFNVTDSYNVLNKGADGMWETATTKVYHSPSLVHNNGGLGDAVYGDGILACNRKCSDFIAIEFEENHFDKNELELIAKGVVIEPKNNSYGIASSLLYTHYRNIDTGSNYSISEYVSEEVLALLNAKKEIAHHRLAIFGNDKQNYDITVIKHDWENWSETENSADLKLQAIRTYRYNTANFDSTSSEVISLHLEKYKDGKFRVTDYCIEGKDLTFADMDKDYWDAVTQGKGEEFLKDFVNEYKNFISNLSSTPKVDKSNLTPFPVVKQWEITTECAAESTANSYVVTYWDEKITCETGLLTVENLNDFDIKVHLVGGSNGEIVLDVLQNTSAAFALDKSSREYTVGIHADVEEDTEIKLVISENEHVSGIVDDSVKTAIAKFSTDTDIVNTLISIAQQYGYSGREIEKLYVNTPWDYIKNQLGDDRNSYKVKTVFDMFIEGKSEAQIQQFVMDDMVKKGLSDDNIKSLTRLGYSPIEIYCMTDSYIDSIFAGYAKSNHPGGANRILMYEEAASQIFNSYKNNLIEYSDSLQKPPADFVFPEIIDWNVTKFIQDEMGYFNTNVISADGKYRMVISVNDNTYDGENIFENMPVINYVAFFEI